MTTDFVAMLVEDGRARTVAVPVKPASQMRDKRVLEKLEIERRYHVLRGTEHVLVTDDDLKRKRVRNLDFVRNYENWDALGIALPEPLATARAAFIDALGSAEHWRRASDVAQALELRRGWTPGTGMALLRHLVASRTVIADLEDAMLYDLPAKSFIAYPPLSFWHSPLLP